MGSSPFQNGSVPTFSDEPPSSGTASRSFTAPSTGVTALVFSGSAGTSGPAGSGNSAAQIGRLEHAIRIARPRLMTYAAPGSRATDLVGVDLVLVLDPGGALAGAALLRVVGGVLHRPARPRELR